MPYLLDGNNLIGAVRRRARPSEEDRAALLAEIADRLRRTRARATVYFDGPAGGTGASLGSLSVRAASGTSADDAIVREVERARDPSSMIVVSADRELQRRVRDAGGRVCSPAEFFARFGTARGPEDREGSSRVDVEEWMRYFGDDPNRPGE
jgi:rRNA-processing protein FCF1